ncbi:MAG: hypothetical protein ACTSXT_13340 [Candidatus Helarchaeota archaeon]
MNIEYDYYNPPVPFDIIDDEIKIPNKLIFSKEYRRLNSSEYNFLFGIIAMSKPLDLKSRVIHDKTYYDYFFKYLEMSRPTYWRCKKILKKFGFKITKYNRNILIESSEFKKNFYEEK